MRGILSILFFLSYMYSYAQNISAEQYINTYASVAVNEMHRSGIPASITLAQGLLESSNGNSPLAKTANNHFGIKCHKEWTGDTYYQDDDVANECFRYYENAMQSYTDHTDFLMTRSRYAFLFSYPRTDYQNWAYGLKQAGYATNPQYPTLLINLITRYNLSSYDSMDVAVINTTQAPIQVKETTKTTPIQSKPIESREKPFNKEVVIEPVVYFGETYLVNNIKACIAKKEDSPLSIANRYNIPLNYLYKYNDMYEGESFKVGAYIFLQPKRNKGFAKYHKVEAGQSMYEISQMYGIKLSDLYEKNLMEKGEEAAAGQVLFLREINANKPTTITYSKTIESRNETTPIIPTKASNKETALSVNKIERVIEEKLPPKTIQQKDEVLVKENQIPNTSTFQTEAKIVEVLPIDIEKEKAPIIKQEPSETIETKATSNQNSSIQEIKTHEVKTGDTLYNISKRYGIRIEDLVRWNSIVNNEIKIGQILKLQ